MHKRWVIADIHGCSNTLKALMEELIRPTRFDEIYFLGDYVDRGPDSKSVIDYIRHLQKDEYNITVLKGNHEDLIIEMYDAEMRSAFPWFHNLANRKKMAWMDIGGKETLRSFKIRHLRDMPPEYIEWMKNLEYYVMMDDFILVHAGLNFSKEDPFEDKNSMLWTREYEVDSAKIGNRLIVHGHVPISLELMHFSISNPGYRFIDLDNGSYISNRPGFGNLVALELNSREMVIQDNRD